MHSIYIYISNLKIDMQQVAKVYCIAQGTIVNVL